MEIKIITGMSGAGKSTLKEYFENKGYNCHDNFPSHLIIPYLNMEKFDKNLFVVDSRTENDFENLKNVLENLNELEIDYNLIYLDCNDEVLINRYRETKRLHHFQILDSLTLSDSIKKERNLVSSLKNISNFVFDTSNLTHDTLLDKAKNVFEGEGSNSLFINCISFGFKHGIPKDIDIFYDVRCFKNPYWIDSLKEKTGKDKEVQDYILSFEESSIFLDKIKDTIDFLIPLYISNGKKQITIGFGCTGGHHRSVFFAEKMYEYLSKNNKNVLVKHYNIKD